MAGDFLPEGTRLPDFGGRVWRVFSTFHRNDESGTIEYGTFTRKSNDESGLCADNRALKIAERPDSLGREKSFKWHSDNNIEVTTKGCFESEWIFIVPIDLDEEIENTDVGYS